MNSPMNSRGATLLCAILLATAAGAQVPGEDPVVLKNVPQIQMRPGATPRSGDLDGDPNMPAWVRARITRYEARAFSANPGDILTDNNVVTTSSAQGMQRTCVQDIASNTAANTSPGMKYGPQPAAQVVVLRGDLVNICK